MAILPDEEMGAEPEASKQHAKEENDLKASATLLLFIKAVR
jgi:predicted small lipoprotein YifL